jgi:hypothetical protein
VPMQFVPIGCAVPLKCRARAQAREALLRRALARPPPTPHACAPSEGDAADDAAAVEALRALRRRIIACQARARARTAVARSAFAR